MGNSNHGTTYMRVEGDDGELRPWHYMYEGRRGRWGTCALGVARHRSLHKVVVEIQAKLLSGLAFSVSAFGFMVYGFGFGV